MVLGPILAGSSAPAWSALAAVVSCTESENGALLGRQAVLAKGDGMAFRLNA